MGHKTSKNGMNIHKKSTGIEIFLKNRRRFRTFNWLIKLAYGTQKVFTFYDLFGLRMLYIALKEYIPNAYFLGQQYTELLYLFIFLFYFTLIIKNKIFMRISLQVACFGRLYIYISVPISITILVINFSLLL